MQSAVRNVLKPSTPRLNIIEEYAAIDPNRKFVLCDHFFREEHNEFEKAVRLLWPKATPQDMKKLGNFLILLKSAAH